MKPLLTMLLMCLCAQAAGATYRWVDETGQVHFSDRPREGAVEVQLGGAQTYTQPKPSVNRFAPAPQDNKTATVAASPYASLRVVRPAPQETYRNIGGQLPVTLSLSPNLRVGHRVRVYYDGGQLKSWPENMLSFTIPDIYRGEHNLRAVVVDAQGKEVASSEVVTFFVHQTSIYNRARN